MSRPDAAPPPTTGPEPHEPAALTLAGLRLAVGDLDLHVDLEVPPGVTALLGPNGAGKTTVLEIVAGLRRPDAGTVTHGARTLDGPDVALAAADRHVGYVPQSGLLFPHLSVLDNVAFAPRARGAGRDAARQQARRHLADVGAADLADRRVAGLSGGQRQRVALARALAGAPRILLLDEPLAAVDAGGRARLRSFLRERCHDFPGPVLLVTHDPADASVLADRVAVLEAGRIVQAGAPEDLVRAPRTAWVAELAGTNRLTGTGHGHVVDVDGAAIAVADPVSGPVVVTIPPNAVALFRREPRGTPRNRWRAHVTGIEPRGERLRIEVAGPVTVVAEITARAAQELAISRGTALWVAIKATDIRVEPR